MLPNLLYINKIILGWGQSGQGQARLSALKQPPDRIRRYEGRLEVARGAVCRP